MQNIVHRSVLRNNEKGIALLLVLWIVTLLSVICAEFSWTMRTETSTVTNFKEGEQAYYTAEAGINRAIVEMMRTASLVRRFQKAKMKESGKIEMQYWEPGSGPYRFDFAGAKCEVNIEDEENKLGINAVLRIAKKNPGVLKNLLQEKIGLEGENRDVVADSLIDWYDKDHNITGVNGAEDDYYESLEPPYECRDGEIPVIEELLLIKGVDEDIYYGQAQRPEQKTKLSSEELEKILSANFPNEGATEAESDNDIDEPEPLNLGLVNIFSVNSKSTTFKPNINTASVDQLLLLEGMDINTAREIVAGRKERQFASKTDRLPQFSNYEVWKNQITMKGPKTTRHYKIKARGFSPDGRNARTISCIVKLYRNTCKIISWKAVD